MLKGYRKILDKHIIPAYLLSKHIPVSFKSTDSLKTLWDKHDFVLRTSKKYVEYPKQSFLDLKILIAEKLFSNCIFCEHRCQIDRTKNTGFCKVDTPRIASIFLHHGEERIFTPSYTIFFSGCNLQCCFCQNNDISQHQKGLSFSPESLADRLNSAEKNNACNVNWVGGDPTPNLLFILKVLNKYDGFLPQVWNSNMYCSMETMNLLNGLIDVYLTDFKFGNDLCAKRLANVTRYKKIITRNHLLAKKQAEVFIRHLILPSHILCCSKPILSWIAEHMPSTPVNIMDQYHPSYKAKNIFPLDRSCHFSEFQKVISFAEQLGLRIIKM